MKPEIVRMARDRGFAVLLAMLVTGLVVGGAVIPIANRSHAPSTPAAADETPSPTPSPTVTPSVTPSATPSPDEGVHGGTGVRFHGDATTPCNLTDTSGFSGNWTHGDYVSAIAAGGDSAKTMAAAQSDCGKPMSSVGAGKSDQSHGKSGESHGRSTQSHGKSSQHRPS